ncbi:MAG: HPP family protein [Gammaproteobacteria bacterium]|nr:HPP family protein [Gammaproteobacteria bacterium]
MKFLNHTMSAIAQFIGLESNKTGHLEKWVSATGGLAGILTVTFISQQFLGLQAVSLVVASMGATAVLVFAVPHGPLSQPWAVLGGHLVSAVIGVACARWIPDQLFASAVAVALAIGSMHYLRCIHPPGGATALTAVIGGANLQALGFQYALTPVLLNAVTIVIIAIVFNYAFSWRRYPASLAVRHAAPVAASHDAQETRQESLNENDLQTALQTMDSTIDISSQDLAHIYHLTQQNKLTARLKPADLQLGNYYGNGLFGSDWQVRQIIDMTTPMTSTEDLLKYKIVAGPDRRNTGTSSFDAFAKWASYEVFLNESSWQRKKPVELVYA